MRVRFSVALAVAAAAFCCACPTWAADPAAANPGAANPGAANPGAANPVGAKAGEVLTFNGTCFDNSGGQRTQLKMGDTIHVGDVLDVPEGAKLKLRMADGSVLALASGSHLTINSYSIDPTTKKRDAKLGLDSGLIRAVVAAVSQPSSFEVDTATSVAAARSTDYFVESAPDKTVAAVLAGSVQFAVRAPNGSVEPGGVLIPPRSGSEIDSGPLPAAEPGAKPATAPRRLAPTPPVPYTQAQFDDLINRTTVAFGLCQCIADITHIAASCQNSVDSCKTLCGGTYYSFVPDARETCRSSYADVTVPGGGHH